MRVAALYDVHAMPWALEGVLAEVEADAIVFGGDFIYGPEPDTTLRRIRGLDATVLRGNCERAPVDWDREKLTREELAWAAALPVAVEVDGVIYCHATPTDDLPVTTAETPDEVVAANFAGISGTVVIGHTHHQFDRRVGDLRVVNAGSVGMPYEGEVAAFWTLVEDGEPRHMRTPVDIERAAAAIRASGWPRAEEFIAENLMTAVSREEAIASLEAER
jgi:diadenosine tetraphosphatase ApaH/serine/threonine PP2A family protein phosphatase